MDDSDGLPIKTGYSWDLEIDFQASDDYGALFPDGGTWRADVKYYPSEDAVIAVCTVTRRSDFTIALHMPDTETLKLTKVGDVHMDIVRTDLDPEEHSHINLSVAVQKPVTIPGA